MYKLILTLANVFIVITIIAQTPQSLKYQAIVRDNSGAILSNQSVSFRVSIRTGSPVGTVVYQETHNTTTNQFGLANINIGEGIPTIGTFLLIGWSTGSKYIETELDPAGGSSYVSLGTSQMLSVPFALYSENTANVNDADADPGNELQSISKAGNTVSLSDGGGYFTDDVNDADANPVNEMQSLSLAGNDLSISDGNSVLIPSELPLGTSGQTMRHNGTSWEASGTLFNDGTNIGIGTLNPTNGKLEVTGGSFTAIDASSTGSNAINASSNAGGGFAAGNFNATATGTYGIWVQSSAYDAIHASGNGLSSAAIRAIAGSGAFAGIFSGGNVGIGTSNPQSLLHVGNGADTPLVSTDLLVSQNDATSITIRNSADDIELMLGVFGAPFSGAVIQTLTDDPLHFRIGGWDRMIIDNSGNIGIGQMNPAHKLDVNGDINTSSDYKISGITVLANDTGNIALGWDAGINITTGQNNIMVGYGSGKKITGGGSNTFLGAGSGRENTAGYSNTFVGYIAGYSNSIGNHNTMVGENAGSQGLAGDRNTIIGAAAGRNIMGSNNTYLGASTGLWNVSGSGNVFIGNGAGFYEYGSNKFIVANTIDDTSTLIYGDFVTHKIGLGTSFPSEKLTVAGTIYSTLDGFKFPDGSIQTSAATTFSLPYDGTTSGNPAFSITNTAGSIAIRGLATDNSAGINYGGYFEAYRTQGRGVAGVTNGIEGWGVMGEAQGSNGIGVRAIASGANGTGIYSEGTAWAGYFLGDLYASGNVGFGTTNPFEEVEIYKNQNNFTSLQLTNINTSFNAGSALYFYENSAKQAYISYANSGNTVSSYGPNSLAILNYGPIFLTADNSSLILQNSGGRVAIGNEDPIGKFDVSSNLRYSGHFISDSSSNLTHVIHSEFTGATADAIAVYGKSVPADYYGYGGYFEGGYIGVHGEVFSTGSNTYFGVSGTVNGGSGTNYAVYGYASGAGTNYAGYFDGNVTVTGTFINPSDKKLKKNIQPFTNALSKVNQLNVHTFEFRNEGEAINMNLPSGSQIGFTAQEMEDVFPELVSEQVHTNDRNMGEEDADKDLEQFTYKGINYVGMIPVLTQAIKEQQEIIENQQSQIDALMKIVMEIKSN